MAKKKKEIIPFSGEDMEQQNSHTLLVGMYIGKKNHFAKLGIIQQMMVSAMLETEAGKESKGC